MSLFNRVKDAHVAISESGVLKVSPVYVGPDNQLYACYNHGLVRLQERGRVAYSGGANVQHLFLTPPPGMTISPTTDGLRLDGAAPLRAAARQEVLS